MPSYEYADAADRPSRLDWARVVVGLGARGVFWACLWFIVGNAVVQAVRGGEWLLALLELAVLPLTFLVYPFVATEGAMAWPLADGTSLIPFLVAALIAYPVSTLIGGLDPIDG